MPRCTGLNAPVALAFAFAASVAVTAVGFSPSLAFAQEQAPHSTSMIARLFPIPAVRGALTFPNAQGEGALLNGQPVKIAPGWRVVDAHNQPVQPASLQGQTYSIKYVMDPDKKLLHTVWLQAPIAPVAPVTPVAPASR